MKLLAKMLLSLLVVGISIGSVAYLLPDTCVVEQTIVLDTSPERVFPYLNNPSKWENWSVWNKSYDPTLFHMYGGAWAGPGARHSWNGDKAGKGQRVFMNIEAPRQLQYEQKLEGEEDTTMGTFILEKIEGGTKITWQEVTPVGNNPIARYRGAWKKYKTQEEIKQSLAGLKTVLDGTDNKKQKNEVGGKRNTGVAKS